MRWLDLDCLSQKTGEACGVVPHRRDSSMWPAAFTLRKLEWSCHTGGREQRGAWCIFFWTMATRDRERVGEGRTWQRALADSVTMKVGRAVWVGDPWCWSLSAFSVCS